MTVLTLLDREPSVPLPAAWFAFQIMLDLNDASRTARRARSWPNSSAGAGSSKVDSAIGRSAPSAMGGLREDPKTTGRANDSPAASPNKARCSCASKSVSSIAMEVDGSKCGSGRWAEATLHCGSP